jgi:formylglycine-generating enzyme required for sulfatase activity
MEMARGAPLTLLLALSAALAACPDDDPLSVPDGGVPLPDVTFVEFMGPWDRGIPDAPPPPDYGAQSDTITVVPPAFVAFAAGAFTMGSPPGEPCRGTDETQRTVTLTHSFQIQNVEVTQQQFSAVMGYQPFSSCGGYCPVVTLSWHEAAAYCNKLSVKAGVSPCYACAGKDEKVVCVLTAAYAGAGKLYTCPGSRLPTEAEREYAYRAGTKTALYNGATTGACTGATDPAVDKIAWYKANAAGSLHAVGQKLPNAKLLYDMAGNAAEWVHDWCHFAPGGAPATDPTGPLTGTQRVQRGGGWESETGALRAAARSSDAPANSYDDYGFRPARTLPK